LSATVCGCTTEPVAPVERTIAAPGPTALDLVRVVEQPLSVQLSLPGELMPFQSVAIYPRVTGFVRSIRVDRGTRVRVGDEIAVLDAPELLAQRAEAQSKLQAAEAELGAVRSSGSRRRDLRETERGVGDARSRGGQ
jgi:multidrug efflux pump subunit AcrA (membrane-fusion protein)